MQPDYKIFENIVLRIRQRNRVQIEFFLACRGAAFTDETNYTDLSLESIWNNYAGKVKEKYEIII